MQTITYGYTHKRLTSIGHDSVTETFTYDSLGRKTGMSNPATEVSYG